LAEAAIGMNIFRQGYNGLLSGGARFLRRPLQQQVIRGPEWSRGGSNNLSKNNALILMGDWCESVNCDSNQ